MDNNKHMEQTQYKPYKPTFWDYVVEWFTTPVTLFISLTLVYPVLYLISLIIH